jgi:lipopolysaccharide heptosyltransferase I
MPGTETSANSPAKIQRLLIVRLGSMGDIIHTLPAVAALRGALPGASLGWVVEERWAELLCTLPTPRCGPRSPQRPLVDCMHVVDTARWRKAPLSAHTWLEIAAFISELRARRYQVAVDFQGAVRSALIAHWSQALSVVGAAQPRENAASMLYTRQVITRGAHVVEQNLSLVEAVTHRPLNSPEFQFPYDGAAERECEERLRARGIQDFVMLNPGAGWGAKQWPAERYGVLARRLAEAGWKALINFGPGEETLAQAVVAASGGAAQHMNCTLAQLIALTRRARLLVGGDTGPMHLAAALGVPVVAIFGPTSPARNGPFGTRSIVLRSPSSITSHSRRAETEPGLLQITVDEVVSAARELLRSGRG